MILQGDAKVELNGQRIHFSGFYFKDGNRKPSEWKTHGPGLVTIRGSRVRITDCAFHEFDSANGGWITVTPGDDGDVPMYVRIDHCSFTHKPSFDQVINLNNCDRKLWSQTYKRVDGAKGAPPMYHRLDHCYFSNPPKTGNAGGGIRVGTWRNDIGRCLIDNNLFERQDSEAEIVTSKSRENIYYNNTFKNCQGTLNFRHGDNQYAVGNRFLATDEKFGYGGMFVWGSGHGIIGNQFDLRRTRKARGEACIYLNAGVKGSEFARADDSVIANNQIIVDQGSIVDTSALLERRVTWAKKEHGIEDHKNLLPKGNRFLGNLMHTSHKDYPAFSGKAVANQTWEGNLLAGIPRSSIPEGVRLTKINLSMGADGSRSLKNSGEEKRSSIIKLNVDSHLPVDPNALITGKASPLPDSPAITLDDLVDKKPPLNFADVGPSWLDKNPSTYAVDGKVEGRLEALLKDAQK